MLVLKRKDGQWITVTHRSGDVLRFRVFQIYGGPGGQVSLAFDDKPHHFDIERPERTCRDDGRPGPARSPDPRPR